jgi:MATE family multidrug resistance protein
MSLSATTFALKGEALASLISQDAEVITLAGSLLVIAAAFQLFDGAQVVMAAALRGAGFTSTPLWSALVSHWGVGLPLAFALSFWAGLGVHGLWWGLCGGLVCASVFMTTRFHQLSKLALEGAQGSQPSVRRALASS